MSTSIRPIYTSCAVNRATNVFDNNSHDEFVFGSGPLIAFWAGGQEGVHTALPGHKSDVTVVQYVKGNEKVIVSGDAAGSVRVWRHDSKWSCVANWQAHTGAVSLCSVQDPQDQNKILLFTASSDSTVKVWSYILGEESPVLSQTITLGIKLASALQVSLLPNKGILLALALTDSNIYLYTYNSGTLTRSATLHGHTDWIRTLTFSQSLSNQLLLASGSQDYYIRLWRISPTTQAEQPTGLDLLDEEEIQTRSQTFTSFDSLYSVASESVLLGHESWVTSFAFSPTTEEGLPHLLSASADRSLILWTFSPSSNLWMSSTRFGELGATPGLGFFGALWTRNGVACHDWGGSVHSWIRGEKWMPGPGLNGHFKEVRDLSWQGKGEWLMSTSLDQTSRLHAPWKRDGKETWHEIARPQIHGHDIYALTIIDTANGLKFASGAEETIVRLFEASSNFVDSAQRLTGCQLPEEERPMAAVVPPLGLSNRAVNNGNEQLEEGQTLILKPSALGESTRPPLEEELLSSTLWPEFEKLYGHGYEIRTLATSHSGQWLASACKASTAEHAAIHLRDTSNWRLHSAQLSGHSLSITRIAFSPDDQLILSVGRDRSWHLHKYTDSDTGFVPIASAPKAHSRVIWDACWCGSSSVFATASRDKSIKLWSRLSDDADSWKMAASLPLSDAVMAVAAYQSGDKIVLAAGTEAGSMHLYSWSSSVTPADLSSTEVKLVQSLPAELCHASAVTRLAFSPAPPKGRLRLASGSEDRSIRICDIEL